MDHSPRLPRLRQLIVIGLTAIPVAWVAAQDLTMQPLLWLDAVDAPEVLPVHEAEGKSARVHDGMAELGEPFYRDTLYFVESDKKRPKAMIARQLTGSTFLDGVLPDGLRGEFKSPALRDGKPVVSEVRSIVIFNPKSAAEKGAEATPRLLKVVPPQFPGKRDAADQDRLVAMARIEVAADGRVTEVRFPAEVGTAFSRLGQRAVMQCEFAPARTGGTPTTGTVTMPVIFMRTMGSAEKGKRTPPKLVKGYPPTYPIFMHRAGIEGKVKVSFEVTVEGRTANVYPVESNNPNFEEAAVEAVEKWIFEPAQVNGRPMRTRMGVPVVFNIQGGGVSMFSVKRPKSFPDALPEAFRFDEPPEIMGVSYPIYPLEALQAGREGKVKVGFFIGPSGWVEQTTIVDSAGPDLDGATIAAVEKLRFKPAVKDGKPSYAALHMEFEFKTSGRGDVQVDAATKRVLRLLEKDRDQLVTLAELDVVPEAVSRQPPRYPQGVDKTHESGTALIEFVIDRKGFARLPHVIEATDPAFGYAAVQAAATWRFEAPRRDGKVVDALVRIPVQFKRE